MREATGGCDVVVVGGGIGGLVAAATAAGADGDRRVALVEPRPLGGRARVDERGGFRFGRGPRALYLGGPAERILADLGVAVATGGQPGLAQPGALLAGRIHRFPDRGGALAGTDLFSAADKVRAAGLLARLGPLAARAPDDRSLAGWLDERGVRGTVRAFVEALVRLSTYADAPDVIPAGTALRQAHAAATRGVRYLDGGFGSVVDGLARVAAARGVATVATAATGVSPAGGGWQVAVADGPALRATTVILATGGPDAAAMLLGHRPPSWGPPRPAATVACLELGLRRPPERGFLLGVDRPLYLSQHAPPAALAPPGRALVHAMRYHPLGHHPDPDADRAELVALAGRAGIGDDDVVEQRFLARMVVTTALPTAASGGLAGRPPVAVAEHPGAYVAGDWVGPEGLLADAVVASAAEAGGQAARRSATMVAT